MTDRITALRALLEAVEAGTLDGRFDPHFERALYPIAKTMAPVYWAGEAYHLASLDAAKALHEAVLGDGYIGSGFKYVIWGSGKASVWHVITGHEGFGEVNEKGIHGVCQARAWLCAILRALISMEEEG